MARARAAPGKEAPHNGEALPVRVGSLNGNRCTWTKPAGVIFVGYRLDLSITRCLCHTRRIERQRQTVRQLVGN